MGSIRIVKPGLLTTIQDCGRWGLQSRGVPVAGPMDPRSHRIANALVCNDSDAAALEVTLIGPEIEFEDERVAAVVGAMFVLSLDGRSVPMNAPFVAAAGSLLRFGPRSRGSRAYLAVAGGIAVRPVLGSRSTHLVSRMGGLEGRALVAGDRLPLGVGRISRPKRELEHPMTPLIPEQDARVRVLPGSPDRWFGDAALEALQSASYRIGSDSDRMGFRLTGPTLERLSSAEMISDATPVGALQVPASGAPILLMADRQTTGGYPKIATVISADIGVAGQLGPGDTISFEACTLKEAMAALIVQERGLMAVEALAAS